MSRLSSTCRDAVRRCESVLGALGLEMTAGGEIEWYMLIDSPDPHFSGEELAENLKEKVRQNPLSFQRSFSLGINDNLIGVYRKKDVEEAIIEIAERAIDNRIGRANQLASLMAALSVNIEIRAQKEGIELDNLHLEQGIVFRDSVPVGQQLEVSTKTSSPSQQGDWLDRLREIILEEGKALGLKIDFSSRPAFTMITHKDGRRDCILPSNSNHIHYGLRFKGDRKNAFFTPDKKPNVISAASNERTLELLHQGGLALICSLENDFDRLKYRGGSTVRQLKSDDRSCAINEVDDRYGKWEPHKELRIVSGNVAGHAAVLPGLLGTLDGLLRLIGKQPRMPSFLSFSKKQPMQTLESIAASITDDDRLKVQNYSLKSAKTTVYDKGEIPDNLVTVKKMAHKKSPLAIYAPEVFNCIEQLDGISTI